MVPQANRYFNRIQRSFWRHTGDYFVTIFALEDKRWTVPAMFPVPKVQDAFDEQGNATDKTATDKRADAFIKELLWCIDANNKMKA